MPLSAFHDLVAKDDSDETTITLLRKALPGYARAAAERWGQIGSRYVDSFDILRSERIPEWNRSGSMDELKKDARQDFPDELSGGW